MSLDNRGASNPIQSKYIKNSEVAKYEGKDYFIYYDRSMVQHGCWVFCDTSRGHMETFDNKKEAFDFLKEWHFDYTETYDMPINDEYYKKKIDFKLKELNRTYAWLYYNKLEGE